MAIDDTRRELIESVAIANRFANAEQKRFEQFLKDLRGVKPEKSEILENQNRLIEMFGA